MILKMHVYSRVSLAIMIAFLTGSIVFMAFDTTPPYEYDESASFVVPSPANDGDQVTVKWRLKKVNRECPGIAQAGLIRPEDKDHPRELRSDAGGHFGERPRWISQSHVCSKARTSERADRVSR